MGLEDFAKHVEKVKDFTKKYSTYSSDKKIAIGRGSKKPVVCFIGEALGKTENQLGKVFCGVSGKLLNEQINHIGLLKKDYVITNVLPFMPTDSDGKIRKPSNKEILDFSKLLKERLDILKPKAIVLLGKSAAEAFGFSVGLKEAGTFLANNFYFVPHPAYLLRNGLKGFNYYRELKEFLKPKNYLKEITVPKQRARNLSTKYMISQELGIFKEIANQMEINFKDIDTKELFLWNGKRFFVHIQKLTQRKDLIRKEDWRSDSDFIAVVYENPSSYSLVGYVETKDFLNKDILDIPNFGKARMMRPTEFKSITDFFRVEEKEEGINKPTKQQTYFPLHMHTEYSIGDACVQTKEYANQLYKMGFEGGAVSDHGHLNGTYYFQKDVSSKGLKSILGIEAYVIDEDEYVKGKSKMYHLCIYAKNDIGWKNLLKLNYKSVKEGFYYKPRMLLKDIFEHKEGLIVSSACMGGFIANNIVEKNYDLALKYAKKFKEEFGDDYYIEIMPHHNIDGYVAMNAEIINIATKTDIKIISTIDTHYIGKDDKILHNAVRAVSWRKKIGDSGVAYVGNTYYLFDDSELKKIFNEKFGYDNKFIDLMFANTFDLANKCNFTIKKFVSKTTMPVMSKDPDKDLWDLVKDHPKAIENPDRMRMEYGKIKEKGYSNYFLSIKDMYNLAEENDIMYGPGRGSVGGSLLAFCLGLTKTDPIKHDLLFSRFISDNRKDLPDCDMDFQDIKRDLLIKKIVEKYGEDHTAKIITFSEWHGKGSIRDSGRIFGAPLSDVNRVAGLVVTRAGGDMRQDFSLADTFEEFEGGKKFKKDYPEVADIGIKLEGRKRHLGVHAAGLIITNKPMWEYIPIYKVNGKIVTGWEKKAVEELGLIKFDILGLKSLDVIKQTLKLAGKGYKDLPLEFENKDIYENIFCKAKTFGVFQFSTIGMQKLLEGLQPKNFDTLGDANALYRPGPLHSGLTADYVLKSNGKKEITYVHDILKEITGSTKGIIIYQEQIMKIMHDVGGLSWATSEMVRKAISKSMGKSIFDELKGQFVKHAVEVNKLKQEEAEDIFNATSMFGCLDKNTKIYRVSTNQYKGSKMTIKEAYEYQDATNFKRRKLKVLSMSDDEQVRYNTINKIVSTGKKEVFYIKTVSNKWIKATKNHVFLINGKWQKIGDAKVGDAIKVTDLKLSAKIYGEGYGKGSFGETCRRFKKGKGFHLEKQKQINKLKKKYKGKCQICGSKKFCEMHYIDGNHRNNSDENTMWLCRKCHKAQSASKTFCRFQKGYYTQDEKIIEIKSIGERETFDIEMVEEPRNFIANNFVSHNSYGYNKSHSYEYAVIAYWMAWLKNYHPKEFFCALLSRESDAEVEKQCIQDAKEFGIKVLPPNVNESQESYIVKGDAIYCGLSSIKGLGPAAAKKILKEKPYKHINGVAKTVAKNVLRALILSGSCDDWIPTRKWAIDNIDDLKKIVSPLEGTEQEEYGEKESIMLQTEVLNFPYGKHPITFFDEEIKSLGEIEIHRIHDLKFEDYIDERWVRGIVTFINFKQEGLEGSWTMFDNVLERKYAHLNISDESGGNILVHVTPEQYTYYKEILERKKGIPVLIKAHSIIDYQKLYCDALIVLDDINYNNPIIKYIKNNKRLGELKEIKGKKGVIQTVTYKVLKNKKPYARLKLLDESENTEDLMVFQLDRDIFVAGEIIVYNRQSKDLPFIRVIRRIK